jgi:hypothetical protein
MAKALHMQISKDLDIAHLFVLSRAIMMSYAHFSWPCVLFCKLRVILRESVLIL